MTMHRNRASLWFVAALIVAQATLPASADGGALLLRTRAGAFQVAIFVPRPLQAGLVDFSLLVQDAVTGVPLPEAHVQLTLTARGSGQKYQCVATSAAATNKLMHGALVELPEPGGWEVAVDMAGPHPAASLRFALEVEAPGPPWRQLWPWWTLPAPVIALFAIQQALLARRGRRPLAVASAAARNSMKTIARDAGDA
jgi:hypothetical protein